MVGYIFNRVRTRRRAMEQLREIVAHRRRDGPLHIAILQARASDEAEELRKVLETPVCSRGALCHPVYTSNRCAYWAWCTGHSLLLGRLSRKESLFYSLLWTAATSFTGSLLLAGVPAYNAHSMFPLIGIRTHLSGAED